MNYQEIENRLHDIEYQYYNCTDRKDERAKNLAMQMCSLRVMLQLMDSNERSS